MKYEVKVTLSHDDIVNILSTANYSCSYWCSDWYYDEAVYDAAVKYMHTLEKWKNDEICYEDVLAVMMMKYDESIGFYNPEDDKTYELTLEKLTKGVGMHLQKEGASLDMDEWDGDDMDMSIQYALFKEVVFG